MGFFWCLLCGCGGLRTWPLAFMVLFRFSTFVPWVLFVLVCWVLLILSTGGFSGFLFGYVRSRNCVSEVGFA